MARTEDFSPTRRTAPTTLRVSDPQPVDDALKTVRDPCYVPAAQSFPSVPPPRFRPVLSGRACTVCGAPGFTPATRHHRDMVPCAQPVDNNVDALASPASRPPETRLAQQPTPTTFMRGTASMTEVADLRHAWTTLIDDLPASHRAWLSASQPVTL